MKRFGLWILFLVFGTALLVVCLSSLPPGSDLARHKKIMELTKPSRKLKDYIRDESDNGGMDVDDYLPNDPVPSSKAIRPGPIEHGTPLMPYIPKPAPPSPGPNESEYFRLP
ncbi:hypothetical protein Hdeb2414_s0016g00477331 [Helianthus debilis subsp. tardiflorus]